MEILLYVMIWVIVSIIILLSTAKWPNVWKYEDRSDLISNQFNNITDYNGRERRFRQHMNYTINEFGWWVETTTYTTSNHASNYFSVNYGDIQRLNGLIDEMRTEGINKTLRNKCMKQIIKLSKKWTTKNKN